MKKLFTILPGIVIGAFIATLLLAPEAGAIDVFSGACGQADSNAVCDANEDDFATLLGNIISTLFVLIGIVSVIMLIVGGFRYVTSNGDSSAITAAKNTILYAVVGIAVATASFAIVSFVLGRIGL